MRIEYSCPSQSGCESLRIYRRACGKSRVWEKHVRPNTNGTVEGRLQGTRKIPLAKVGIPSVFRRREDVNLRMILCERYGEGQGWCKIFAPALTLPVFAYLLLDNLLS